MYKICVKCDFEKDISEFREYKKGKFRSKCKNCERGESNEWYFNNCEYCKERNNKYILQRRLYTPWIQHLNSAKQRCTNPKKEGYNSYGKKGIKFKLSHQDGEYLWYRDNADLMDQPCIDRINTKGDYIVNNCQFLDKEIHDLKTQKEMGIFVKKVIQLEKNKTFRKKWDSQTQIINLKRVSWSGLKSALEHSKLYKGFYWIYEKDYKNNG